MDGLDQVLHLLTTLEAAVNHNWRGASIPLGLGIHEVVAASLPDRETIGDVHAVLLEGEGALLNLTTA